jgi:hypothetical protein
MFISKKTRDCDPDSRLRLRAGELVQVRSKAEIVATLDANARLDALPFMPEMLKYSGKQFRVYKRAHKTCDTIKRPRALRMENAVHLDNLRCDGSHHGGCQAGCLLFWKEAWVKRVDEPVSNDDSFADPTAQLESRSTSLCTEGTILGAVRSLRTGDAESAEDVFTCQATELVRATSHLAWWDVRQFVSDITSGNVGLLEFTRVMAMAMFNAVMRSARGCFVAVHHRVHGRRPAEAEAPGDADTPRESAAAPRRKSGGDWLKLALHNLLAEYPHICGTLRTTPSIALHLQVGELVEIKSKAEIVRTLDNNNRNRGLAFDAEMVPYCGGTYRVLRRVERILNEKTGRMLTLPNDCVILEGVVCRACFSQNRLFCPRSIYSYWREIWLRRVGEVSRPQTF